MFRNSSASFRDYGMCNELPFLSFEGECVRIGGPAVQCWKKCQLAKGPWPMKLGIVSSSPDAVDILVASLQQRAV